MKITIFGLAGTGKSTTAKMLADNLHYEYMSTGNMFRAMASELGMSLNEFEILMESDEKYDREIDQVRITEYGKTHSNFVLESRLAWYFVPDSVKIRLFCDDKERLQRVANRENKTFETVLSETNEREDSIYKRYKNLYGIENINNADNFELNIDTTHNNPDQVLQIILDYLNTK